MTARVVDLGRVQRALARLDDAVKLYPYLTSAEGRARLEARLDHEEDDHEEDDHDHE